MTFYSWKLNAHCTSHRNIVHLLSLNVYTFYAITPSFLHQISFSWTFLESRDSEESETVIGWLIRGHIDGDPGLQTQPDQNILANFINIDRSTLKCNKSIFSRRNIFKLRILLSYNLYFSPMLTKVVRLFFWLKIFFDRCEGWDHHPFAPKVRILVDANAKPSVETIVRVE